MRSIVDSDKGFCSHCGQMVDKNISYQIENTVDGEKFICDCGIETLLPKIELAVNHPNYQQGGE